MKGILTKISDDKFGGNHPNGINTGYVKEGTFTVYPLIGEHFHIGNLKTSKIIDVMDGEEGKCQFKTQNSTYLLDYSKSNCQ